MLVDARRSSWLVLVSESCMGLVALGVGARKHTPVGPEGAQRPCSADRRRASVSVPLNSRRRRPRDGLIGVTYGPRARPLTSFCAFAVAAGVLALRHVIIKCVSPLAPMFLTTAGASPACAGARRRTADSFSPRRASDVRYSAAVCGSAGSATRP